MPSAMAPRIAVFLRRVRRYCVRLYKVLSSTLAGKTSLGNGRKYIQAAGVRGAVIPPGLLYRQPLGESEAPFPSSLRGFGDDHKPPATGGGGQGISSLQYGFSRSDGRRWTRN